jgi:hypothetical protein
MLNLNEDYHKQGRTHRFSPTEITRTELTRWNNIKTADFDEITSFTGDVHELYDQYLANTGIS